MNTDAHSGSGRTATPTQHRAGIGLLAAFLVLAPAATGRGNPLQARLEIPYRRGTLVVDGRPDDWRGPALDVDLEEPELAEPGRNHTRIRLVWDRESLFALFEVHDAEVFAPPPQAPALTLYQWDAVEIYLDTNASGGPRMDAHDFQVLITCDGQVAVLEGDPVLAQAPDMTVPKTVRQGIVVEAVARIVPGGFTVECAIPFAAVGVHAPHRGVALGLDLAVDDWTRPHPPLPYVPMDLDNVVNLATGRDKNLRVQDPAGVGTAAKERLVHEASFPWAWSGTRDFGYPNMWHRVTLAGGPALEDRVVAALGATGVALGGALLSALVAAVALLGARRRHRARISALRQRLADLERSLVPIPATVASPLGQRPRADETQLSEPPSLPTTGLVPSAASPGRRAYAATPALAARAMQYIQDHLEETLSPAHLAEVLHVSRRSLERAVASSLGCTPRELLLGMRMESARRLLADGLRVGDVADRVGFVSAQHFSRSFKQYYGVPPSSLSGAAGQDSVDPRLGS